MPVALRGALVMLVAAMPTAPYRPVPVAGAVAVAGVKLPLKSPLGPSTTNT